jgi:hypothetical protein
MAYVVRRPNGSWEIRESVATPKGPRSRTLAGFRRYTPGVVGRAVRAAQRPTSADEVYAALQAAGAVSSTADEAARALLAEVAAGRPPSPGLRRLVVGMLGEPPAHDVPGEGAGEWLTATENSRGTAVRDLMRLTDRLPHPPPRPLAFPPLAHRG